MTSHLCECGHTVGDHQSNRSRVDPKFGLCLIRDCECREFHQAGRREDVSGDRYTVKRDGDTFAVMDTLKGVSVGAAGTEQEAAKSAQALNAFLLANKVRVDRAKLHREVRTLDRVEGGALVADIVSDCPKCVERMTVVQILGWIHRVKDMQAANILYGLRCSSSPGARVGISETRTLGSLTARERRALADYLRGEMVRTAA